MESETVRWQLQDGLEFEWDSAKALVNLRKHRVPFRLACEAFKDATGLQRLDDSDDYDEERWILLGRVEETILFVVYTHREQLIRLISARKATRNEQRSYWAREIQT
jgi:uncharacterized DUF497 family protein